DKKVTHVVHTLTGRARVSASFKVVDVSTGALIVAKTYDESREDTNRATDRRPPAIDRDALYKMARHAIVKGFMHAIAPHKEYMDANFLTDGDLPQLEGGIGYAKRGDWKKAQDAFNGGIQDAERNPKINAKVLAKAYWNLGLAYEYAGDYDKATAMV